MPKHSHNLFLLAALLGPLSTFGPAQCALAQTQPPKTTQAIPSKAEFTKLYEQFQSEIAKSDEWAQKVEAQIPAREFLTQDEGKKFDALIIQPNLTGTNKTQLAAIITTGLSRRNEYQRGQNGQLLPPNGYGRVLKLKAMKEANKVPLRQLTDKLRAVISQQQDDINEEFTDKINKLFGNTPVPKDYFPAPNRDDK